MIDDEKLYHDLGNSHPDLKQGVVKCPICGKTKRVISATCLREGWPICCGYTMTLVKAKATKEGK